MLASQNKKFITNKLSTTGGNRAKMEDLLLGIIKILEQN